MIIDHELFCRYCCTNQSRGPDGGGAIAEGEKKGGGRLGILKMEKFAVDLDAVLDEFEYHEGQVKKATT